MWNPDKEGGDFWIIDWKRCLTTTSGFSTSFQNKCFKAPLDSLPETKLNEWSLQVNIYREILEDKYGLKIAKMGMLVLHAENARAMEFWHERSDSGRMLLDAWKALAARNAETSEDEALETEPEPEPEPKTESAAGGATSTTGMGGVNSSRLPLSLQLGGAPVPRTNGGSFQPYRLAKRFGAPAQTCSQAMLARHVPAPAATTATTAPTAPTTQSRFRSASAYPLAKRFRTEGGGPAVSAPAPAPAAPNTGPRIMFPGVNRAKRFSACGVIGAL
jgi:hypothetical protein